MTHYPINQGSRNKAIRMGCESGLYEFCHDYAADMGMSASAAVRRLVLIGARCEKEHGNARMPASYGKIVYDPEQIVEEAHGVLQKLNDNQGTDDDEFDWGETDRPTV